jgi:hypothetical protein
MGEVGGSGVFDVVGIDSFMGEAAEDVSVGGCGGGFGSCVEGVEDIRGGVGVGQSSKAS